MARKKPSSIFDPPPPPDIGQATAVIEQLKESTLFDEFVATLVVNRAILFRRRERSEAPKIIALLKPEIKTTVNANLIMCICSNNPQECHDLSIPVDPPYKNENSVKSRVREMVERVYPDAHHDFIRQKVTGCMKVVQHSVVAAWTSAF